MEIFEDFKNECRRALKTTTKIGRRTNRWLLILNIIFIGLLFWEIFFAPDWKIQAIEILLGGIFAVEIAIRFWVCEKKKYFLLNGLNFLDLVVVLAVFGEYFTESVVIFQIVSGLRFFRFYRTLAEMAEQNKKIYYYYEVLKSLIALLIFIFVMSESVFYLLGPKNENINNFVDALYFTITTLTTTGFGDITVSDPEDKLLVIFIMVVGVALFLQLIQNVFRPKKTFYRCKHCGLIKHEPDASHCKHCGNIVNITTG